MNKSNDEKIKEYKKKKIKNWIVVILSLIVLVLEILALFNVVNMIWGLLIFIIIYILKKIL